MKMNLQQVNNLGKWLGIVGAITLAGIAWGEQGIKIEKLEEAVAGQATIKAEVAETKAQSARIDERTKALQQSSARQEQLLQRLLQIQLDHSP